MYFPSFPWKTSFLVYTKPLFCLLRHLSFQSWKHLWCILFFPPIRRRQSSWNFPCALFQGVALSCDRLKFVSCNVYVIGCVAECTKPTHSQSLANFVANFHSQGISATRTRFSHFIRKKHSHSLANSFATLNLQLCLWDLVVKIRWRILGARQNSHSHSQLCRCDRGALRCVVAQAFFSHSNFSET